MPGYKYDRRNPRTVSEMTDANALRGLACALDQNLPDLTAAGARKAVMYSIQVLNSAAKELTPARLP